jgi:ABC-type sugar transport system permease subunit
VILLGVLASLGAALLLTRGFPGTSLFRTFFSCLRSRQSSPGADLVGAPPAAAAMMVFLAGLQAVPVELYDAAKIDGANAWQRFRNVTLPLISPTIFFNVVISVIGALSVFSIAYIATQGGPGSSSARKTAGSTTPRIPPMSSRIGLRSGAIFYVATRSCNTGTSSSSR